MKHELHADAFIRVGEVMPNVAAADTAEQSVSDSMGKDISIGMTIQA